VETAMLKARDEMVAAIGRAVQAFAGSSRPTKGQVIEFGRWYRKAAAEALAKYGDVVYRLGVDKAREQAPGLRVREVFREQEYEPGDPMDPLDAEAADSERDDLEVGTGLPFVHLNYIGQWYLQQRQRADEDAADFEDWYDENPLGTGDDLAGRAERVAGLAALGLWGVYQSGFKNELADDTGYGTEPYVDYVAVGDEDTCDPCRENADGSPYPASEAPTPGDDCMGGDNCRCELRVSEFAGDEGWG